MDLKVNEFTMMCGSCVQKVTAKILWNTLQVRFLPPSSMKQFWEQYKLISNLPKPAGFPTFWKVASEEIQVQQCNNDPAYNIIVIIIIFDFVHHVPSLVQTIIMTD